MLMELVGYDTRMNQLLEWSPLLAFFVVFELFGIYWATGALMLACVVVHVRASHAPENTRPCT
jgi:intracellular septation protein A